MSEAVDEVKDAKAEGQIESEAELSDEIDSPVETDANGQAVQADTETDVDEQPVQDDVETSVDDQIVQADAETDAEATDLDGETDEEASVKAPEKSQVPEVDEKGKDGPSTADFVMVSIFAAILGLLLCLPTFLGSSSSAGFGYDTSGGVATNINGVEIGENDVTNYVNSFRTAQGLEDDDVWGQWLVDNGYTPEQLRSDVIEYFTTRELFVQAAKELDVEVPEADVDAQLASIAEQVGGEEALSEALEMQGTSIESYRETISLGLLEEALVEKVGSNSEAVTDEAVLEVMKMYFPDQVSEDAESLEGLDTSMVDSVRTWLKQQAFSDWFEQYRGKAAITANDMPEGLPYAIDLSGYEKTTEDLAELMEYSELEDESQDGEEAKQ